MQVQSISDQKRLARGEHWLRVRYWLRARDNMHNHCWSLLMIAGPAPAEEIRCIRELMPAAVITAVDIKRRNAEAALAAGADEAMVGDIGELEQVALKYNAHKHLPPLPLRDKLFDAVCIDLTGPADDWLRRVVNTYWLESLVNKGVMIVTFSYGRDVVERIDEEWQRKVRQEKNALVINDVVRRMASIPDQIAARCWSALRSRCGNLESCMAYKGSSMPMVSCLMVKKTQVPPPKFVALAPGDYENVIGEENIGNIYALPADRVMELRRKAAARKAVHTRTIKQAIKGEQDGSPETDQRHARNR